MVGLLFTSLPSAFVARLRELLCASPTPCNRIRFLGTSTFSVKFPVDKEDLQLFVKLTRRGAYTRVLPISLIQKRSHGQLPLGLTRPSCGNRVGLPFCDLPRWTLLPILTPTPLRIGSLTVLFVKLKRKFLIWQSILSIFTLNFWPRTLLENSSIWVWDLSHERSNCSTSVFRENFSLMLYHFTKSRLSLSAKSAISLFPPWNQSKRDTLCWLIIIIHGDAWQILNVDINFKCNYHSAKFKYTCVMCNKVFTEPTPFQLCTRLQSCWATATNFHVFCSFRCKFWRVGNTYIFWQI